MTYLRFHWHRAYLRQKYSERFWSWAANRLPRRLRYYTWINVSAEATTDDALRGEEVPAVHLGGPTTSRA